MLQAGLRALKKYIQEVKVATTPRGLDLRKTTMLWDFTKEETIREWTYIDDKEDVEGQSEATFGPNGKGDQTAAAAAMLVSINRSDVPQALELCSRETSALQYPAQVQHCTVASVPSSQNPDRFLNHYNYDTDALFYVTQSNIFESGRIDVGEYDVFQLKVRGDGRRFIANLRSPSMGRDDELWQHFVFTRGGPEWEIITVSCRVCVHGAVCNTYWSAATIQRLLPGQQRLHAGQPDVLPKPVCVHVWVGTGGQSQWSISSRDTVHQSRLQSNTHF